MAVPEEIRKVERPKNTKVVDHGGTGLRRYAVIARTGCKRVDGKNIPVEGGTVGHIIDGRFVPMEHEDLRRSRVELKDYADVCLVDSLSKDLLDELEKCYSISDARKIYVLALLRVCNHDLPDAEVSSSYQESWASMLYPSVPLSKNTVSALEKNLGNAYSSIIRFMRNRTARITAEMHIAIDGTLITDNSIENTLSAYSRKARIKGTRDISVLYAYDVDTREPICSKVYGGNIVDATAYRNFLEENKITKGVIIGDKGFPQKEAADIFMDNDELGWICPLKRNDRRIDNHSMLDYEGRLPIADKDILYKKAKGQGCWLYSFRNRKLANKEEADFYDHHQDSKFDMELLNKKLDSFGTCCFECNQDLDPLTVYRMYSERWMIEEYFKLYKYFLDFDTTDVHSDASVYGRNFVNFISSIMTSRLVKKLEDTGLLDKRTFKSVMTELAKAKKVLVSEEDGWQYVRITKAAYKDLCTLGLATEEDAPEELADTDEPPKRKRGRPRKVRV